MECLPQIQFKREPQECPWTFVKLNFYKLIIYYANRYAEVLKDLESKKDIRNDIYIAMVEAYQKYRMKEKKPLVQVLKILKTVPVYYYQNKINRKRNKVEKADILTITISDIPTFISLYDKYYEKFLTEYMEFRSDITDEKRLLFTLLYPTQKFRDFVIERKGGNFDVTKRLLFEFMREEYKWTERQFDDSIIRMRRLAA